MLSPRGHNFGLGLEAFPSASASRFWSRPGLDLVVLLCKYRLWLADTGRLNPL